MNKDDYKISQKKSPDYKNDEEVYYYYFYSVETHYIEV